MAATGDGELAFDSGEVVTKNNNTGLLKSCNWNEYKLNLLTRNDWRASLVPAAAVIPAPIAYTKVVAVKKLVVRFWDGCVGHLEGMSLASPSIFANTMCALE